MIRRGHIRQTAGRLLDRLRPQTLPIDVEGLATRLGAVVRLRKADESLSGFLVRDSAKGRIVIGVNSAQHPNRQRFTIAHEIGHLLLHEGRAMYIDSAANVFRLSLRNQASSTGESLEEREANLFAAELLMPSRLVAHELQAHPDLDVHDDGDIRTLAERFGVSPQALSIRLGYLGYSNT